MIVPSYQGILVPGGGAVTPPSVAGAAYSVLGSAGTSVTISSYSPSAGSDRLVVAVLSLNPTSATAPTNLAATFGGNAMTKLSQVDNGTAVTTAFFYIKQADWPGTPADIVASWTTNCGAVLISYTVIDVDQTTPLDTVATNTGSSTTPSVAVSSAVDDLVLDFVGMVALAGDSFNVGAGQTQIESRHCNVSSGEVRGASSYEAGAASVTMSWTNSSSFNWAIGGVSVNPA